MELLSLCDNCDNAVNCIFRKEPELMYCEEYVIAETPFPANSLLAKGQIREELTPLSGLCVHCGKESMTQAHSGFHSSAL